MILSAAVLLVLNTVYLALRVSGPPGGFPRPLSAKEEREYLIRNAQGDLPARNKLIEHNLRLVAHVVKKYYAASKDQEDLISIGTIGLIKGISTFNMNKGARLATYAARCIENEILMYFRTLRRQGCEVSLSEPIDNDGDGNSLALMDVLSCDDEVLERIDIEEKRRFLKQHILTLLDEREREIIILRYGLGKEPPLTQREIAARSGISRSYVSRIEKKALQKLETAFCE